MDRTITTPLTDEVVASLHAGDRLLITGIIYTGRDAAHKRLVELIDKNEPLPIDLSGQIMVLTHTGRKSGLRRRTPVNYALVDGEVYCTAGFGQISDWYRNILANPQVEVWLPDGWWAGVNWWATRRIKASVGYGNIDLDRFGQTGNTKTLLTRMQWIY